MNKIVPKITKKTEFTSTTSHIVPAIYSLSTNVIKYLGGKIIVRYWKNTGMEFIGNIRPDSINAGKKPIPKEIWLAKN